MIRAPRVLPVVRPDLLGPAPSPNLRPPPFPLLHFPLLVLHVVQFGHEHLERQILVLQLRTLLGALDPYARGLVKEVDCRLDLVHVLPPRPAGSHRGYLTLGHVEVDVDVVALGHDGDGRRRGVTPPRRFRGGDPLDAVHARLPLHPGVDRIPCHLQHGRFVSPVVPRGRVDRRHLPSHSRHVLPVHVEQIAGEDVRLGPARPRAYLQHDVPFVVGVLRKEEDRNLLLQCVHLGFDLLHLLPGHLLHFGVVPRLLEQFLGALELLLQAAVLIVGEDDLLALGPVLHHLPQEVAVGDDVRIAEALGQRLVRPADAVESSLHLFVEGHGEGRRRRLRHDMVGVEGEGIGAEG
mmetsp:Transcript_39131/g.117637  ORF Transcript_39131/g.117637 Transcript_39131/m.117637 type:complete len:350 (-) Transcript_39131:72-1121(-)